MIDDRTVFLEWLCTEHSAGIMKDQQERLADGLRIALERFRMNVKVKSSFALLHP